MATLPPSDSALESTATTLGSLVRSATRGPLQAVSFWTGVLAPLAYPPLLVGELTRQSLFVLCGVVALNVCGLLLGRGYSTQS
jgi:hypothetical protein